MDEEGEEPFVPLDSLLEVNLVEDTTARAATLTKTDSFKDCGQGNRPNGLAEDAVNSTVSYAKSTGLTNSMLCSNFDPVQIAWGMDMEEDMFYKDLFKDVSTVRFLRLHCTVCDTHLGCKPGSVLMRHVRLGTLLCKDCFTFYGSGEFPVAEDGSESFCYWCGQGGNVICCSSCSAVFCKKCIKQNYTKSTIKEIETSPEWLCFVCNYRSLWEHRAVCRAAITYESSDLGSLEGVEEKESPGHYQEFCCGPTVERRIPRLKSSMPSEVTFGEYIKAGRVKASIMRMLRNISSDSNGDLKTENKISTDSQKTDSQKSFTHSAAFKELVRSQQSVTSNHPNKERAHTSVASRNISFIDTHPLISQAHFSSINSQPNTGLQFLNQGMRPKIISSSQTIPSGRIVVMPPVHIPHHSSVIRIPQQNSAVEALSLGALLRSSPPVGSPVGSVTQPSDSLFRLQSRTSPLVVVKKTNGGFMPMYVNNSANFPCIQKELSHISGVPHYVQNQDTNAVINHPRLQEEKAENIIKFPHNSVINSATTYQSNTNDHSSQNVPEATIAHTTNSHANSKVKPKSKTKSGYIQVRSPTALQSVTVSDIVHSPLPVSESDTCVGTEQQSICNSQSVTVPLAPTSLAEDQNAYNSLLTESHFKKPESKPTSRLVSSTTNLEATSLLKTILTDVPQVLDTSVNDNSSSKEMPQAHVVNQTCPELPSRSIDAIETKWFKETLLEAENVAKYMLTRITCVQEELDCKSHQKQEFDDMINNFSKLLEIAGKKLADVNSNFTTNFQRWKGLSPSCHADISQGSCAKTEKKSSVEAMNGHNTPCHDEVEIISVKVRGKRKRSNSGSQVTCTEKPGLHNANAQDAPNSDICTESSDNNTYKPRRMFTRRSKAINPTVKCCYSCEPDQQLHSKQVDSKQTMGSSRVRSERLRAQENFIHIPEKRQKLKDLRIVLERIPNPGTVFKREPNDTHSTINSNATFLVKDHSYLGPNDIVKELKPCSVVVHRLDERDITHCI